jgi:hypothetical protein
MSAEATPSFGQPRALYLLAAGVVSCEEQPESEDTFAPRR